MSSEYLAQSHLRLADEDFVLIVQTSFFHRWGVWLLQNLLSLNSVNQRMCSLSTTGAGCSIRQGNLRSF